MAQTSERLGSVIADIDAANADDPRKAVVDGVDHPYEQVYSRRMGAVLKRIYPDASELLTIAAHAQHIRRWDIARETYPMGREGYNKWRRAAREHHGELIAQIMDKYGYGADEIGHVVSLIKKEQLKKDKDSQALENVVAVVFLEFYWDEFVEGHDDYDDDKFIDILGKTLKKMSPKGHEAALALSLPERTVSLVSAALEREKDALAKLAEVAID